MVAVQFAASDVGMYSSSVSSFRSPGFVIVDHLCLRVDTARFAAKFVECLVGVFHRPAFSLEPPFHQNDAIRST